jgi:hypothetical protein
MYWLLFVYGFCFVLFQGRPGAAEIPIGLNLRSYPDNPERTCPGLLFLFPWRLAAPSGEEVWRPALKADSM